MKRVLWGSLFVLMLQFGFTSVSQAAEIPPTAECASTMKTQLDILSNETSGGVTDKEQRQAARRFFDGLVAAGCLSDAEAIMKPLPAKPFTSQCATGAAAAQSFWAPMTQQIKGVMKAHKKTIKPMKLRLAKVNLQLRKFRQGEGSRRQFKRLLNKRESIQSGIFRRFEVLGKKINTVVAPDAYGSTLVFYELFALRCTGNELDESSNSKGPAARVIRRNMITVFASINHAFFQGSAAQSGEPKASSTSVSPAKLISPTDLPHGADLRSLLPR